VRDNNVKCTKKKFGEYKTKEESEKETNKKEKNKIDDFTYFDKMSFISAFTIFFWA